MPSLAFDIPGHFTDRDVEEIRNAVCGAVEDINCRYGRAAVVADDDLFAEEFGREPIVRASTYSAVGGHQEIAGWWNWGGADRPVLMRGSRIAMTRKRNSPVHICNEILDRFLRIKKYTCLDLDSHIDFVNVLIAKLINKGWDIRHWARRECIESHLSMACGRFVWIAGMRVDRPAQTEIRLVSVANKILNALDGVAA